MFAPAIRGKINCLDVDDMQRRAAIDEEALSTLLSKDSNDGEDSDSLIIIFHFVYFIPGKPAARPVSSMLSATHCAVLIPSMLADKMPPA